MGRSNAIDVRERLLCAGVETFRHSGFNGCSVQDITEAAGVPKGSFYNHFDSKEALGAAALERFWKDGSDLQLTMLQQPGIPAVERLRAYFEWQAECLAKAEFTCGCLAGNMAAEMADRSPLVATQLSNIFQDWSRRIGDCIRQAQAEGSIGSTADADSLATFVLNAWEGAVLRARIEKGERPLRQFIETLFTQLLRS
jgi:TetR/AcrR family transcriptional repressor of nem operon